MEARGRPLVLLGVLAIGCGSSDGSTFFEDTASSDTASTTAGLTPVDTTITAGADSASAQSTASGTDAGVTTNAGGSANVGGSVAVTSGTSSDGAADSGGTAGTGGGSGVGPGVGGASSSGGVSTGGVGGDGGSGGSVVATGDVGAGPASTSGSIPVDGTVTVRETCDFEPCGGDLDGEHFDYVGACVEERALLGSYTDTCEELEIVDATGTIEGTIGFENGRFEQDVSLELSVEYHVPQQCLLGSSCTLVAAAFASAGAVGTRCRSASNGGCNCTRPISSPASASGRYTTDDDELTLGGSTVNYCASGNGLLYSNDVDDWSYVIQATNP